MGDNLKQKTMSGMIWRFAERCGAQIVSFVVSIVIARFLDPEHYGTLALMTIIVSLLQVFAESGMSSALIQKKDADDTDFSSAFFFNLMLGIVLYAVVFFTAPVVAWFFDAPDIVAPLRVLGVSLILFSYQSIQQAYVSKHMLFKRFFYSTIGGTVVSGIVGIVMAYRGFGIWALVFQTLTNTTVGTLVLFFTIKWRPKLVFSFVSVKKLFNYGWKILAASLVVKVYKDLRQLVIEKRYTSADLAFYNRGQQFPSLIVDNVNISMDSVLLSAMSSEQEKAEHIRNMMRRSIRVASYVIWPMMFGLIAVSEPLIRLLLTEKWLPCVPLMCILCFSYGLQPIQTANVNAIKAMGKSGTYLKLEIIKKSLGVLIIIVTAFFGVEAIAWGAVVSSVIASFVNSYPNQKMLKYSYLEQIKDILPSFLASALMCVAIYPIKFIGIPDILCCLLQVVLGATIYIILSLIFRIDSFLYLLGIIRNFLKHGRK